MSDTILTPESSAKTSTGMRRRFLNPRRLRHMRESLLAYGLLLPAIVIIGLFGLFPLIFSAYQSTRRGLNNVVGRPGGLFNYVRAMDNLAYVIGFWVAAIFLLLAIRYFVSIFRLAREKGQKPWLWAVPGLLFGVGLSLLLQLMFAFMPGLLEIGQKMRAINDSSPAAFRQFWVEAFSVEAVQTPFRYAILAFVLGLLAAGAIKRFVADRRSDGTYFANFTIGSLLTILGLILTLFVWQEIQAAYAAALEEGEALSLWSQIVTISAGFILLGVSYALWKNASMGGSNATMFFRIGAALILLIGAWVLIGELPQAIAEGNEEWWDGLKATIFYAAGSLPLQLFIALVFATLLFQNIRAKGFFRLVYFLPYVTPAVGSAAVFRVLFSGRDAGPINSVINFFGGESFGWLNEPAGVFQIFGERLGVLVPEWAAGPSLALTVVIIYSIWRYTGYNTVFFLAGLGNISNELYEAASIDGAGRWAQFRNITFPLLSPTTYFLTILGVIGTFKAFNTIFVLRTRAALGTMDTASLVIFDAFKRDTRYGYAAALAIVLLIIIMAATYLFNKIAEERVFYG